MATFSAKTAGLDRLDYDFRDWLGGDGPIGIIPEPSDKMIEEYFDRMKVLSEESGIDIDVDNLSEDQAEELMERFKFGEMQEKMMQAVSDLCSNSPKAEDLLRLPYRIRQVFLKWLMKQINDPELSASATKQSRGRRSGG